MGKLRSYIFDNWPDIIYAVFFIAIAIGNVLFIQELPWLEGLLFWQLVFWVCTTPILIYLVFIIGFMILCYIYDRDR
jgi:hypothetical protein